MVDEATAELNGAMSSLQAELDAERERLNESAKLDAEAVYAGRVKLGELEANKILLEAKQSCVTKVYETVRDMFDKLSDAQYLALMQKLILGVCEDGDEIIAAAGDKRVTDAWVKKVSAAAKKKLTLGKERGDFGAGVVLRNGKYDRSLTADDIVAELKERTLSETAARLGLYGGD